MITYKEYISNPQISSDEFYSQFITSESRRFVLNNIGMDLLLKSNCKHFNDIIPVPSVGGWIWDRTPIPVDFISPTVETNNETLLVRACIGKATARQLLREYKSACK